MIIVIAMKLAFIMMIIKKILNKVLKSDIIIFSTPLYWYSMSASLKLFIDRWTESLRDTQIDNFKEIMSQKKLNFNHRR